MAEGITLKRIIDMDEATELTSSDYALVDSATGGPKKFALGDELSSLKEDLTAAQAELAKKANTDGYYEEMTVGNAEQLVSTVYEEDSVPYIFRTAGGSMDIGDREEDMLVGGSVAWNQLIQNGNFADGAFGWGGLGNWKSYEVVDGTLHLVSNANQVDYANVYRPIANGVKVNHVYVVSYYVKASKDSITGGSLGTLSGGGGISGQTSYTANAWFHRCGLSKPTSYTDDQLYIRPKMTTDAEEVDVYLKNINCTDLTQMFGSTIADYIYSLETATSGAGVAWFRKLFPKDYYAYNAGSMLHVGGVSSHDMVGFNQWDEEWELGKLDPADGRPISSSENIRSKNFIPVLPNTTYFWRASVNNVFIFYDAEKNYIINGYKNGDTTFQTPTECRYIKFYVAASYGTIYKNDICINLSWDGERDGEYEPYVKRSYPLDSSLTLRGIPKLDSANNLYYDGDTYESDGTVTRRYGIVDLGSLTWSTRGIGTVNALYSSALPSEYVGQNTVALMRHKMIGDKKDYQGPSSAATLIPAIDTSNVGIYSYSNAGAETNTIYIVIPVGENTTNAGHLVYELATPTTETAEPYQNPQIVDDFGTEEYVTTSIIPVGHVTKYQPNLRAKLEMSPDSPDGDGDYIVRQTDGGNSYVSLASTATIQDILARLTALEGNTNEG